MITLYCFSATGNSLTTARRLQKALPDCRLRFVSALRTQSKVIDESEAVGFVFPVYYSDMPWPVRELISKMVFRENAYIFCIMTCRGHSGTAPQRLDALLRSRGQKLSFAERVLLPGNSFLSPIETDAEQLRNQDSATAALIPRILARETADYASAELLPLSKVAYPNNFRGITAEEHCTACGICMRVCPMENIRIKNGRALIGDNCATCLACFHFCPTEAIWMSRQENIARRRKYHHPEITLHDILAQKKSSE